MSQLHDYFHQLPIIYSGLLDEFDPYWSSQIDLNDAIQHQRENAIAQLTRLQRPIPHVKPTPPGVGLNTIGLLSDRLTILVIKEWCLRHHYHDERQAQDLYNISTQDIIEALTNVRPAVGILNSKLTIHQPTIQAKGWEDILYDLFATNVLIWKAQEVFYCNSGDPSSEHVQDYLHWVPRLNIQRDALIQGCEQFYWQLAAERCRT